MLISINQLIKIIKFMHKDLASFQNFLYRHLKCHPDYDKMRPSSNQPARYFVIAKTHKFDNFKDINIENLFIIDHQLLIRLVQLIIMLQKLLQMTSGL